MGKTWVKPAGAGHGLVLVTDFEMSVESPSLGGAWFGAVDHLQKLVTG